MLPVYLFLLVAGAIPPTNHLPDPLDAIIGGELGTEEYATHGFINHNIDGPGPALQTKVSKKGLFAVPFSIIAHFASLIYNLFRRA